MFDNPQSLAGIITKHSSNSVAQTVDRLTRVIADRDFTLFRIIDHSGQAEQAGVLGQRRKGRIESFHHRTPDRAVTPPSAVRAVRVPAA